MKTEISKKAKVTGLLVIYLIAWLYQSREVLFRTDVFADIKKVDTNIVAVLVDKDLYSNTNFKNSLERYTTQYIQQKISNSKAVVFPLDTTVVKSRDIAKLLENLYYDGIEKEPSTLEGVILVGDKIPLPVVNDNGAIFPTVFPYTDFDDPKFYRDPNTQYFLPNGVAKAQPEVRHSIINLESNVSDYVVYFQKLKSYHQNPNNYIGDRVWYEDFIDQKESYNDLNLVSYMNKFLFAEDLGYHRFNPLLIDFFNKKENQKTDNLLGGLATLTGESGSYAAQVGSVFSGFMAEYNTQEKTSSEQIPTVFVDDALQGFEKKYSDLYGVTSSARMRDNVLSAGRRKTTDIDSHNTKVEYFDQLYTKQLGQASVPLLVELNKKFEDELIKAVKNNDYPLHIAIPEKARIEKNIVTITRNGDAVDNTAFGQLAGLFNNSNYYDAGIYEAFYYGKNASTITSLDQTSIFLGTQNPLGYNLNNLTIYTGYNQYGSLGVSQGILSEFVEANRGYVVSLGLPDKKFKEDNNICANGLERFSDYVKGYLGGNTPLNLTGGANGLELIDKSYDRGGKSNWLVNNTSLIGTPLVTQAGDILHIAGSRRVYNVADWMIAQNLQGGYLQRVAYQKVERKFLGRTKKWAQVNPCNLDEIDSEPLKNHNIYSYNNLIQTGYQKTLKIGNTPIMNLSVTCPVNSPIGSRCFPYADKRQIPAGQFVQKQNIDYKIIDSTSLHNAPNPEQISKLDMTTPSRPIDSVRYVTFQGIGGDQVKFLFPNLYEIEVYKQDPENPHRLLLKTKEEIRATIRSYLIEKINEYNEKITEQNNKKQQYYSANTSLFTVLGNIDPLATPNRTYSLLQPTMFVSSLSEDILDSITNILYVENSLIPYKQKTTTLSESYEQFYTIANLTNKKEVLLKEYLTNQLSSSSSLTLPGYQGKGYELISLVSDGDDSINSQKQPSRLIKLQKQINDYKNYQDTFNGKDGGLTDNTVQTDSCSAPYGEPVPLVDLSNMSFPWFKVFACWLEHIGVPKVSFDFKNAQGPVFLPGSFKDLVNGQSSLDTYSFSSTPSAPLSVLEQQLVNSLDISLSAQTYSLEDKVPLDLRPVFLLTQKNDPKPTQLRITSTGDTCVIINNINTCTTPFQATISDKNYISPYLVPAQPKAGTSSLIIQLCQGTTCVKQTLPYFITPGPLAQTNLSFSSTKLLSQSQIPIFVTGKDKYNNNLTTLLSPLSLETDKGKFVGGATKFTYANLRDYAQLVLPKVDNVEEISINVKNKDNNILANKKLSVYSGSVSIVASNSYYNAPTQSISYTLPNQKSQLFLQNNNINIGLLPQLSVNLQSKNGDKLAGPVIVQSQEGLFSIYEKTIQNNSSIIPFTGLQKTNTLIFDGNKTISLVLQPKLNNNIGSDILIFKFPDGSEQRISVTIKPAEQASRIVLEANTRKKLLDNSTTIPIVMQLLDDWGNISASTQSIQLDSFGSLSLVGPSTLSVVGGISQFMVKTDDLGGIGYVRANAIGTGSLLPGLRISKVKKSIIPKTNINGLYLNIIGASRGNTTDKDTDYYNTIPKLFQSSKILSTTTELIAPEDISTSIFSISDEGVLSGQQSQEWIITFTGSHVIAQNPLQRKQVTLGDRNTFSWSSKLVGATDIYAEDFNLYPKKIWSNGSTNSNQILYVVNNAVQYQPNKNISVEESTSASNNIGRRNNQHHLTQFGQGKSVGEATLLNASEFLVNYGDPLITRKDKNTNLTGANVDSGPGQLIVTDTTKTVKKAFALDVNNDGLEDIVTVFTDGSVIWSKQYGGKESIYVEMGPLLQIYGTIKDVFGGDTQGDGFGDIIVQTENDDLRVYTNLLGIFNVDGYPICLSSDQKDGLPQRVDNIDQRFVEDMDNDGIVDIVLNKSGEISIVYGGKSGNGYSYISQDTIRCDSHWETRQKNHKKIVDNIGVQLHTGTTVDTSLIRWKGLTTATENLATDGNVEDTTVSNPYLTNQIVNAFTGTSSQSLNIAQFPVEDIVAQSATNLMRRSVSPIDYSPSYETLPSEDIRYISTAQLQNTDQVRVYKTYENLSGGVLKKGDTVQVKVRITGPRNDAMTYIDRIQGPWNIMMNSGVISGWNPGNLPPSATYNSISPQGDFYFVVDNITLGSSNTVEFSYTLVFQGGAPIKITISDRNHDDYKDISVYPIDSCSKFLRTYINDKSLLQSYRAYDKEFLDIGQKLEDYHTTTQNNTQNYLSGMTNSIQNIGTNGSGSVQDIFNNAGSEVMSFGNFFNQVVGQGGYNSFNLNVTLMGDFDTKVSQSIQNTLDSICSGGPAQDQSCSAGLPVPFNMSFLSPGNFNIMGCKPKVPQIDNIFPKDGGFPVFAFPANLGPIPSVGYLPLPFPRGGLQKGATDSYGYFGFPPTQGPYSSQVRIYLSPTLTQQMGMAICFGPQTVGKKLPDPFSSIGGNCIVTAIKTPSGSCNIDDPNNNNGLSDQDILDLSQFGQCTQTTSNGGRKPSTTPPSSPFTMVTVNNNGTTTNPFPPGTYFGVINFEKTPVVLSDDPLDEGVILQGGKAVRPQIQGGGSKGLVACIVNDWMDRQTNYIVNNFTNMQIGIYLPDLSQLGEGFDSLGSQINSQQDPITTLSNPKISNNVNTFSGNFISQVRNSTIKQSNLNSMSTSLNNPFKEIERLFDQTPLVNINTQDVVVNVPMIYSEDITRYEAHLKSWIERNKQTAQDRTSLLQGVFGLCSREYSLKETVTSNTSLNLQDQTAINELQNTLKARKNEINTLVSSAKTCQQNGRKKEGNCVTLMNNYNITTATEGDKMILYMDKSLEINTACLNILGGDLSASLSNIMMITAQTDAFENRVRENIKVLDQYKRFPLQLYQWIHVTDRYLGEIASMVENFLGYINMWLNTNATRFEQYVDAIITISTALETWQAILDLSVDRQKKCSTCTVDSYDAYACSLGFLCGKLKLPILKLPPFKIPNIYIDLSHIDLGMDILLPNFQFVPTSVPLIEIPDLPQPPSLIVDGSLGIESGITAQLNQIVNIQKILDKFSQLLPTQIPLSVPTIPVLPQPPVLPELPSFIPNINVELPVLPPAPKLPRIAPEIETVINVVSFFSDLYCIVKGGIGLVGENNVKTRIEQLTQRTWEIPLFDNINLTQDMSYQQDKLEGFDFKIDAYLNFTMNFTAVYDLIQGLADSINQQTKKLTDWDANKAIGTDKLKENVNNINNYTQQNIDLANPFGYVKDDNLIALKDEQNTLREVTEYMANLPQTPSDKKQKLSDLVARIDTASSFIPQTDEIANVQNNILGSLDDSRNNLKSLSQKVKDYDSFISSLDKTNTYTVYNGNTSYSAKLFDNEKNINLPKESLMNDYIGLQRKLLSNYDKGLYQVKNSSNNKDVDKIRKEIAYLDKGLFMADTLYRDDTSSVGKISTLQREYNALDGLEYNNQAAVCSSLGNMSTMTTTLADKTYNAYPLHTMTAQVGGGNSPAVTTSFSSNLYDFSSYKNKIMIPFPHGTGTRYVDVLQSDYFSNLSQGYQQIDLNNDKNKDIIHRNQSQVWVKYGDQNASHESSSLHTTTTKYYVAPVWDEENEREERSNKNGYLTINGTSFKIYSKDLSVKNLRVRSQDYDSFTLSWSNSKRQQEVHGYILELNTLPDAYHLKAHNDLPKNLKSRYVILLPNIDNAGEAYLAIHNQLNSKKIKNLTPDSVIDVVSYNDDAEQLSYTFKDIERSWYYTRITSLTSNGSKNPVYTPSAPWSHHVVAGQQLIADTDGPIPQVRLIREKTNGITDTGLNPQGIVNTKYRLEINWDDPSGVLENWITTSTGGVLSTQSGSFNILSDLYFVSNENKQYYIGAKDSSNNQAREGLLLTISVPTIQIDDIIQDNLIPGGLNILSSVSKGMDDGIVKFERKRNNIWTVLANPGLSGSQQQFAYPLGFDQTVVTGGVYNKSHGIEFFSSDGKTIAKMNNENGEITIQPEYINKVTIKPSIASQVPSLLLYDIATNNNLFIIKPKATHTSLQPIYPYYLQNLTGSHYGSYVGGSCIMNTNNECVVVMNTAGDIVIPSPYHNILKATTYKFTDGVTSIGLSTQLGNQVGTLHFRATLP